MKTKFLLSVSVLLILSACGGRRSESRPATPQQDAPASADWRVVATDADRDRLRQWRAAWMKALPAARAKDTAAIDAQGALFDPDRALSDPIPPPGRYRCRVFKLGAASPGGLPLVAYPFFDCRVEAEGDLRSLFKESGSQRPVGLIFPDGNARAVFLGTMMLGDEQRALDYGQDQDRNLAGFIDRVGERRWRLALPWPRYESQLDIVELVPAS